MEKSNILSVNIGSKIDIIDEHCFSGFENLNNVVIPNTVAIIKSHAFENCDNLTSIYLSDDYSIAPDANDYAFPNNNVKFFVKDNNTKTLFLQKTCWQAYSDSIYTIDERYDINEAEVYEIENKTYNGQPQLQQNIVVIQNDMILQQYVDYELSYENNINAGTATVIINGIGPIYTGQKRIQFTISPMDISSADVKLGEIK